MHGHVKQCLYRNTLCELPVQGYMKQCLYYILCSAPVYSHTQQCMYCTLSEEPVQGHVKPDLCYRQHGMPAEHFREDASYKLRRSVGDRTQHQGIPARHWDSAPEEEEQGDSLDAFVVETRLVPVSLSQIPDRLPDKVSLSLQCYIHTHLATILITHNATHTPGHNPDYPFAYCA